MKKAKPKPRVKKKIVVKRPEPVVLIIEGPPRELTKLEKLAKWFSGL